MRELVHDSAILTIFICADEYLLNWQVLVALTNVHVVIINGVIKRPFSLL